LPRVSSSLTVSEPKFRGDEMDEFDNPAERLFQLFATNRRPTREGAVRRRNNGFTRFCELSGINPTVASRWRKGVNGHGKSYGSPGEVPPQYNDRVLLAVDTAGIPRDVLKGILKPATCATCGREMGEV